MEFVNLSEAEASARERLPYPVYCYYAGGAHDEITLAENRRAYDHIALRPRVLVDVSRRDLSTTVLGERIALPVLVAPMAFQRMAHPDGELATVRAVEAAGSIMTLSTLSTASVEDVRAATVRSCSPSTPRCSAVGSATCETSSSSRLGSRSPT
jgi:4-hydroxymandelate oxidase